MSSASVSRLVTSYRKLRGMVSSLDLCYRLCALIALVSLPALSVQFYNQEKSAKAQEAAVRRQALQLVQNEASEESARIEGARQFLVALAQASVRQRGGADCSALLRDTVSRSGEFDMLGVTDADGHVVCNSAGSDDAAFSVADYSFFGEARRSRDFTVGEYAVGRMTGMKVLHVAYPLHDETGAFQGVIYGGIRLDRLAQNIATRPVPAGGSLLITDRRGTVLFRQPDGEHWVGNSALEHVADLLTAPAPSVHEVRGLDGIDRLFSYMPVAASPSHLFFSVGLQEDLAFAKARRANRNALLLTALGLVVSAVAAWFASDALVRRPARALIEAAMRWRRGDYGSRVAIQRGGAEFQQIAAALDELVDAVEARERELRRLNAGLEARVEERTRELAASEARYRAYFQHTAECLFVVDVSPDGRFVYDSINPAQERAAGLRNETVRGKSLEDVLPAKSAASASARYRSCIAAGAPIRYDETLDLRRGQRHAETLLAPVKDQDGRIVKILGSSRDVTEQKHTEAQLRRAQKMEAIGQLTGGIAHDFNNLLTTIIGNLDRIKTRASGDERMLEMVDNALRAGERGAQLTSQLLSFARRQALRPEPVSIGALIAETGALMNRAVGESIRMDISIEADLWCCCIDAAQFENALLNLVFNARDAMPGGGSLSIGARNRVLTPEEARAFDLERGGEYVRITVMDTGNGMDDATLGRVFEPFFTTKPIGKGSGLGLPMVHGFAAQSGGTVTIDSAVGRGTTVSLLLPRVKAALNARPHEKRAPTVAPPSSLAGYTVLLLEDESEVLDIARTTLEEAGCYVRVAHDGPEALALLHGGSSRPEIDLLFADVVLPNGMNGVEVARAARQLCPALKVLLTSGYADDILSQTGIGTDDLVIKPYRPRELVARMAALLQEAPDQAAARGTRHRTDAAAT